MSRRTDQRVAQRSLGLARVKGRSAFACGSPLTHAAVLGCHIHIADRQRIRWGNVDRGTSFTQFI